VATPDPRVMEEALDRQRRFWKSLGIVVIVMMVVYAVIMILMVVAGIGSALLTT
jgi:hypothetical protein